MPEFTTKQIRRIDEIYKAAYEFCKILTEKEDDLVWDASYLGEVADAACDVLVSMGFRIRFPTMITTDSDAKIVDYYDED